MTWQRRIAFWGALALGFLLALWLLRDVLLPFVAALVLSYLLNPVANRLERLGVSRVAATLLILLVFILVFVLALIILIPMLGTQLTAFVRALPAYVTQLHEFTQARLGDLEENPIAKYIVERMGGTRQDVGAVVAQGAAWVGTMLTSLWSGGQTIATVVGLVLVTPIVAFYILVDWHRMLAAIDGWVPRRQVETVRRLAAEIDGTVAAFIRGQAFVCLILGLFYGISLTVLGINFGLLIGFGAGIISFIPYVGMGIGLVTALSVSLVQFGPEGFKLGMVVMVFLFGQVIDGYVLQPKLVGEKVGLHPVWLMFALFAFGTLFGFVGLLLAVPLAAAMRVLISYAIDRYLASTFYAGPGSPTPPSKP